MRAIRHGLIWALTTLLVACGGGGDSGGSTTPTGPVTSTATFPLAKAYQDINAAAFAGTFTIAGKVGTVTVGGSGSLSVSAPTPATFESISGFRKLTTVQGTLTANGQTTPLNTTTTDFFDSNYRLIGSSDDASYLVVIGSGSMPSAGRVGDTGGLYAATLYADSSKTTKIGTVLADFQVLPDTADTVLLQIRDQEIDLSGAILLTSTSTYRIATNGTYKYLTEVGASGGTALTFTFN